MDKVKIFFRRLFLLIIACGFTIITCINVANRSSEEGLIRLVDAYVTPYYESLNANQGITNINGISNVCYNMEKDGYSLYNINKSNTYIDVSFVKDGYPSYRYYFTYPEGQITILSSDYEGSHLGVSYILDEKK